MKAWILLLCVILTIACAETEPANPINTAGVTTGATTSTTCTSDNACGLGYVCALGNCVIGQCNIDKTCPAGQNCDLSTYSCSGSTMTTCADNSGCSNNTVCVSGTCVAGDCVTEADCNPGQTCNAQYRCIAKTSCIDGDGDGYGLGCTNGDDCDDANAMINPGVTENESTLCDDGKDNDCKGGDAICGDVDLDMDGFTSKTGDCDDSNPEINPSKPEVPYNLKDDDCNMLTKDDDRDGDGIPSNQVGGMDCDDSNRDVRPGARDIPGDGIDQDCNGSDAVPNGNDADGDGITELDGDCNDNNPAVAPNKPEVPYNGIDDDCKAETKDNDLDSDGFDSPQDCDDNNAQVNSNQQEIFYNQLDDDCSAMTVDGDKDGDGFISVMIQGGNDCDDNVARVNPMGMEATYNGLDDDCNPNTKDDDLDNDGVNRDLDCDETNDQVNPNIVENASTKCDDGVDNNCVGGDVACDANAVDSDGDGIPDDQDCAPNDRNVPGPIEVLGNNIDDDCNENTPDAIIPCDNDAFDVASSNDLANRATAVEDANRTGIQYGSLMLCGPEVDWYSIRINAGDGIEADVTFDANVGDIDVELYRTPGNVAINENTLILVDSSNGVDSDETVYDRRASEAATYLVKVIHFQNQQPQPYQLTVNVFNSCVDDVVGGTSEHNDFQAESATLPALGENRQICDYDDDWYSFSVSRAGNVGVDAIFKHANGDLDMKIYNSNMTEVASSVSSDDDESITQMLAAGTYFVKLYGYNGAKNSYKIFKSSGTVRTATKVTLPNDLNIPDATANGPGRVTTAALRFANIPAGSIVKKLKLVYLDLDHSFLRDLVVTMKWDGQAIKTIWNRDGDANGGSAGLDDDGVLGTDLFANDIEFKNRIYPEFAGLDAQGDFTLTIEDNGVRDTGTLVDLEIEIDYLVP
jgi:hypothetical protein